MRNRLRRSTATQRRPPGRLAAVGSARASPARICRQNFFFERQAGAFKTQAARFEANRQAVQTKLRRIGKAFFDAGGDLAQGHGEFGGDLCGHVEYFDGQLDRRPTFVTIQNADQSLFPPGFGPVVDGLVADLQHLANIHHVASLVQCQQTQRPAAKVAKAVALASSCKVRRFSGVNWLVQQVAFGHGRLGRK